ARPGYRSTTVAGSGSDAPSTPARCAWPTAPTWRRRSWPGCCATTRAPRCSATSTPAMTWPARWRAGTACRYPWPAPTPPPGPAGAATHPSMGSPRPGVPATLRAPMAEAFRALWETLRRIGADPAGGWTRPAWSDVDLEARAWFTREATARGLAVETDRNGNLFAWLGDPGAGGAVVTGSHLDSVPHGGAYDGALGVASALLALDLLAARGATPRRPVAVAVFAAEEGARFGVPCLGSGLLTGAVEPDR